MEPPPCFVHPAGAADLILIDYRFKLYFQAQPEVKI